MYIVKKFGINKFDIASVLVCLSKNHLNPVLKILILKKYVLE